MAVVPKTAAGIEENPLRLRLVGCAITAIAILGLYFGSKDKKEANKQIDALVSAATHQATTTDIDNLHKDLKYGFDRTIDAINKLGEALSVRLKTPGVTPTPTPVPTPARTPEQKPASSAESITLGPSILQHVRASQRRTESNRSDAPFALQVILQTDISSQPPTAFMLECNGDIEDGSFFIAGQPAMMGVSLGVQADKRYFYLRFQYPAFTPESPLVVTLISKTDIRVTSVTKAN